MPKNKILVCLFVVSALILSACNSSTTGPADGEADGPSVTIKSPSTGDQIKGNVVNLVVETSGIDIVAADGDTTGETGHIHVYVDGVPVPPGEVVPKEEGIIHSTSKTIEIPGLTSGEHTLSVILGDGTHTRIGAAVDVVTVVVDGPTLVIQDGAKVTKEGSDSIVSFDVDVQGAEIVAADGDDSGQTGHLHVFIDPEAPPTASSEPIAKEDDIVHSTETSLSINVGSRTGQITLYVVLGDGNHVAFDPLVMDVLTIEI